MSEQFSDRLKKAMELRNIKATELSEKASIPKSAISQYLSGLYEAKQKSIFKLANVLNVSEAWLMGLDVPMERKEYTDEVAYMDDNTDELLKATDNFEYFLQHYPKFDFDNIANEMFCSYIEGNNPSVIMNKYLKDLPLTEKSKAKQLLGVLYNTMIFTGKGKFTTASSDNKQVFPLLGLVKAGYNYLANENIIGWVSIDKKISDPENYFALKIVGDSMQPILYEDDMVIVHRQNDVESGQVGIVLIEDEEATIKKIIKHEDYIELKAFNSYYPPKKLDKNIKFSIIGKVTEARISKIFE